MIHCLELAKTRNSDVWSMMVSLYTSCTHLVHILYTDSCLQGSHHAGKGKRKFPNPADMEAKKRREEKRQLELEQCRKPLSGSEEPKLKERKAEEQSLHKRKAEEGGSVEGGSEQLAEKKRKKAKANYIPGTLTEKVCAACVQLMFSLCTEY